MKWRFSIKHKLFLAIGIIAVIFISLFFALNFFFFDKYYMYSKKNTLIDIYNKVNSTYTGDAAAVANQLEQMEYTYGVRVSILNKNISKYDSFFSMRGNFIRPPAEGITVPRQSKPFVYDEDQLNEKGYTLSRLRDMRGTNEFLSLIGSLKNKDILIVSIPVAYLKETSSFTSFFLLIAGFATLFVCVIISYFISNHFSKPLIEINGVAAAMATLDFDKKYTGKARDEIGQLGNGINLLSSQLQKAIGDLKQSNLLLEEEVKKERKIDEMRKEFVINVSHELKTPIALVQGYAEGLKVNISSTEEDKNYYCDIIIDEASRMNKLVMQLLDLSRIETGNVKPEFTEIDLKSLSDDVVSKTRLLAVPKKLSIDCSNVSGIALGDFYMMEQVLTNYITNAINHSPNDGKILLSSQISENKVRVSVKNQGEPIPESEQQKIWEKFYKVDKSRTRSDGGTGIGLSIVKAIMEAHGGAYGTNNLDRYVEFYFELNQTEQVQFETKTLQNEQARFED